MLMGLQQLMLELMRKRRRLPAQEQSREQPG